MKPLEEYVRYALERGAKDCVPFSIEDICFDSRTLLKCMYGCSDWGRNHTCPSRAGSPTMAEYREMFSRYQRGLIIHTQDKALSQHISYELERMAFLDGCYFAFSLSDCSLCKTCAAAEDAPCRFQKMARPAFHSVGIDVFRTVRKLGLPLEPLKGEDDTPNWYSAVFLD